jgi:hypothetical protein
MLNQARLAVAQGRTQGDARGIAALDRQALPQGAHLDRVAQRRARAVDTDKAHILRRHLRHLQQKDCEVQGQLPTPDEGSEACSRFKETWNWTSRHTIVWNQRHLQGCLDEGGLRGAVGCREAAGPPRLVVCRPYRSIEKVQTIRCGSSHYPHEVQQTDD